MEFKNEQLSRQLDLLPVGFLGEPITVIGAGAIGSFATLALAKMGFGDITVFDYDKIEAVNLNCQFYKHSDIGRLKVEALKSHIKDFTDTDIQAIGDPYVGGSFPGIVISAVDSMAVRKLIWEEHKNKSPNTRAIIDPRMGAETALLYVMSVMDKKDIESYEKTLYSDAGAVQEPCSAKSIAYTSFMLSGLVTKAVKDLLTNPTKHLRIAQWSIKDDQFFGYKKS